MRRRYGSPVGIDAFEIGHGQRDPVVRSLQREAAAVYEHLSVIKEKFKRRETKALADGSPLVFLRSELLADQTSHHIPVAKALVPGFEMMADFDPYCRIRPRRFTNYLKIHKID